MTCNSISTVAVTPALCYLKWCREKSDLHRGDSLVTVLHCDSPSRRRRLRVRASSTSDADFLASLTQLMQDRNGMLLSPPPARPRSSSSSLQRSLSSSPSRQEPRDSGGGVGPQGRSRSPSSFSGSPPVRHAQDRPGGEGRWSHATKGKSLVQEGKGADKVKR